MTIEEQIEHSFGLESPVCKNLDTPANDVIEVTTPAGGHYALKLYNAASRKAQDVQWELDLTLHLIKHGAPVARPVSGKDGYVQSFAQDGDRAAVLFEWAPGEKPKAEHGTYVLLGQAAALIHKAADTFASELPREKYDAVMLIDEQLERMEKPLKESNQWQRVFDLTERLRNIIANPALDWGVCHMDLTLDNVHRAGDSLTVFDLDSAGESWRAIEAWRAKKLSEDYLQAWLAGYRTVREFSENDEKAVGAFGIVADIRNVVWELGYATSSRGKPSLQTPDLPKIVDKWLEWEKQKVSK